MTRKTSKMVQKALAEEGVSRKPNYYVYILFGSQYILLQNILIIGYC